MGSFMGVGEEGARDQRLQYGLLGASRGMANVGIWDSATVWKPIYLRHWREMWVVGGLRVQVR